MSEAMRKKTRSKSHRASTKFKDDKDNGIGFYEAKELQDNFDLIIKAIEDDETDTILDLLKGEDMKYYLKHNDLDYNLIRVTLRHQRIEFLANLEKIGYSLNKDMLLIELYDNFMNIKNKNKLSEEEKNYSFNSEDFSFLIQFEDGKLINRNQCHLEFYFLLLTREYDLAILLIKQRYAEHLKDEINQMFIGDENNLLEHIVMNPEIAKQTIKLALNRQLDGVAK